MDLGLQVETNSKKVISEIIILIQATSKISDHTTKQSTNIKK